MNSESNSSKSNSSKNNDYMNIDLSPISEIKVSKEAIWHNIIKKPNNIPIIQNSRRIVKSLDLPSKRWGHSAIVYNKTIILFGGRHSTRSLANIYYLDISTMTWNKIEPLGQIPPARDSHSCILVS